MTALSNIIGWFASVFMVFGYLPQALTTIRTRNTEGISLMAWLLMAAGGVCFILQGLLTGNIPLAVTNIITATCSIIVLVMKIANDRRKRRGL